MSGDAPRRSATVSVDVDPVDLSIWSATATRTCRPTTSSIARPCPGSPRPSPGPGVRATFFVVGRDAPAIAPTLRALAAAGHEIASHTLTHPMPFVRAAESSVLLGGPAGPHKIEGVGIGATPPLWDPTLVDEILAVKTDDAKAMARRLAREEALFAGTSSGANVVAAIQVAERLGPGAKVVTLMADSGLKYLSTDVYRSR